MSTGMAGTSSHSISRCLAVESRQACLQACEDHLTLVISHHGCTLPSCLSSMKPAGVVHLQVGLHLLRTASNLVAPIEPHARIGQFDLLTLTHVNNDN
eukprot:1157345-Pelagomonas_calceolata.AAC.14